MMNLVMWISSFNDIIPIPAILKPKVLWTGKQIFSLFLPDVNYYSTNQNGLDDTSVVIERGELVKGMLGGSVLKPASNSLIHIIWLENGAEATRLFLDQTQAVINQWLLVRSFTVGLR